MKKHFVTFYSPGTFVSETTRKPIASWDVKKAVQMSKTLHERYGAKPYGFQFSTRTRGSKALDSKVSKTSGMYFLGGKIRTLAEVRRDNKKDEKILLSNMECNKYERIVENNDPTNWNWSLPLETGDVVLEVK